MSTIGHNGGPPIEAGHGFRKLAWQKARTELLPTLPLEIVRLRVARAKRLGLPYKTYATIRATSGRDIVAFLFSGNALDLRRGSQIPAPVAARLRDLPTTRLAAIYAPGSPEDVAMANPGLIDMAGVAPDITASWRATRDSLRAITNARLLPSDGVVLVAATGVEREWCAAAGLAATLPAEGFFDVAP